MTKEEIKKAVYKRVKDNLNKIILYQDFILSEKYNLCWRYEDNQKYNLFFQSKEKNQFNEYVCINIDILKDKKNTVEIFIY